MKTALPEIIFNRKIIILWELQNYQWPEPKPEKPMVFQMDYTDMTVEEQNRNCIHYNTKVTPMSKPANPLVRLSGREEQENIPAGSLKSLLSGTVLKDVILKLSVEPNPKTR